MCDGHMIVSVRNKLTRVELKERYKARGIENRSSLSSLRITDSGFRGHMLRKDDARQG